ncbi:hypothetical protein M3Y99_00693800 [Aphelenchoides fujianensis]|nr:hypothetical protein M3Y99_00693800 [Aphelenchoides fujianensis]
MVTALKIGLLKTKLQHLFDHDLTAFMVHEETLHEAYNSNELLANGTTLQAELASIGQTLAEFVTREFRDKYTHVPDPVKPCFISVVHIRQAGNLALPAPPAAAAQPQAPPPSQAVHAPQQPPASVPLQSPISPAAPLGAAFDAFGKPPGMTPPPGFGAHSGMPGQYRSGRESTNEDFGSGHGYQVDFPSSVSSTRANSAVNFEPHNTSLENEFDQHLRMTNERPPIPPVAPASPAAFFQQNGGFGTQPRPASREQVERRQEKIIKQLDEHGLERDDYEDRDATDVYGGLRSTNTGEPSAFRAVGGHELEPQFRSTPYGFEQAPVVDVDGAPARRAESNGAIPPPPGFSPVPPRGASFPPASSDSAYADAEIESVCLEPADDRRRSVLPSPIPSDRTLHPQFDERPRANGVQRSARQAPSAQRNPPFFVDPNKLYYRVSHSSINNSAQVNAYRRELYDLYARHEPDVFASLPDSLHELAADNDGYGMGSLIHCLQHLNARFPNGMRPKQLIKADCRLSHASRCVPYFGLQQSVLSLLECLESGLIVARQGRFHVRNDFLDLQLWHVPIGLTSNLFRMLFCYSTCSVQELVQQNSLLKDQDGYPVMVSEEDVIRQANCFPFLFEVTAPSNEQNSMRSAQIKLSDHVQKWRIVLDSRELSRMPTFCDCNECTDGAPPVVVHEYD